MTEQENPLKHDEMVEEMEQDIITSTTLDGFF